MSPLFLVEVIVLVVLSVAALALGGSMAMKPGQRAYEMLRPVTWAMVFGSLSMTCTGLTNLCVMLGRHPLTGEVGQAAFSGLAELIIPVMVTFAVLTVAWGLAAIGLRRLV
jgi:hypothetical protein